MTNSLLTLLLFYFLCKKLTFWVKSIVPLPLPKLIWFLVPESFALQVLCNVHYIFVKQKKKNIERESFESSFFRSTLKQCINNNISFFFCLLQKLPFREEIKLCGHAKGWYNIAFNWRLYFLKLFHWIMMYDISAFKIKKKKYIIIKYDALQFLFYFMAII